MTRQSQTLTRGQHLILLFLKTSGRALSIATWNVRTLYQSGKLDNVIQEMAEMKVGMSGLAETRWTNSIKFRNKGTTMVYSGGQEHRNGVEIIMNDNIAQALLGCWPISDRIIIIKMQGKLFDRNIIKLYAPTLEYNEGDIEVLYEEVQTAIKQVKSDAYYVLWET